MRPDQNGKAFMRMKALGDNMFVVQVTEVKDAKPFHLFDYIRQASDKTGFELIKGAARPHDLSVADEGKAGFRICPEDSGMVCIETLKGSIDYAANATLDGRVERFNILTFEQ